MTEKKAALQAISERMSVDVSGLENYREGEASVLVANHRCMRDIFSVPTALPEASKIVLSSRLMWKRNTPENSLRREVIENSLYGIPLEVHAGEARLQEGLSLAVQALLDDWPLVIFAEGAYTGSPEVTKGRTGATRILFDAVSEGARPNLIPVGIDQPPVDDLDDFTRFDGTTNVVIGAPIEYESFYERFVSSESPEEKRLALRGPIDLAMRSIAKQINKPYVDEYIPLWPRTTMVLESGEEVPIEDADEEAA